MPRWCFVSYFFFHWHSCEKNLIDGKIKCFYNWRIVSLTFYFFVYFVFRLIACFYDENKRTSWLVLTDQDSFFFLFLNRVLECNLWIASEKMICFLRGWGCWLVLWEEVLDIFFKNLKGLRTKNWVLPSILKIGN